MTTLMDMPREVLAGLAAGVLATLGSVALALLKVALWVIRLSAGIPEDEHVVVAERLAGETAELVDILK